MEQLFWFEDDVTILSDGFPNSMVLLDCETTGGNAERDRIIEVGLIVVEFGEITERWHSLVNPEKTLPLNIQKLTGITPSMLESAPTFSEVAQQLQSRLSKGVLVAHYAKFDYGFLQSEFKRIGSDYEATPLCSVKFSRSLYKQFKRHSLDHIIKRFNFSITHRHRAMDDADIIYQLFLKTSGIYGGSQIKAACDNQLLSKIELKAV